MAVTSAPGAYVIYEAADSTELTLDPGTARVLDGLRLVLVVHDPRRAEILSEELRKRRVAVGRLEAYPGADLAPIRDLDPEVVLFDPGALGAAGLALTRALNADDRLRWASVLRCDFDKLWKEDERLPDLRRLASLMAPLVDAERSLRQRVRSERSVVTELDRVGPNRTLRVLAAAGGAFAVKARTPEARAELTFEDGRVVTATYESTDGVLSPVFGDDAVGRFMGLRAGLLEIERIARAPSPREETRRGAPSPRLLDASRDPSADPDVTERTAPVDFDEAELLTRPTDPDPRFEPLMSDEQTRNVHISEKPQSDREETRPFLPPSAFSLPSILDADYGETVEEEAWTSPVVKPYRPSEPQPARPPERSIPVVRIGEPSPPIPPKPKVSPREGARRGSSAPPKRVRSRVDTAPQHGGAAEAPKKRQVPKPTPLARPRVRTQKQIHEAKPVDAARKSPTPTAAAPAPAPVEPPPPTRKPTGRIAPVIAPRASSPPPAPTPPEDVELDEAPTNPKPPPPPAEPPYAARAATEISERRPRTPEPRSNALTILAAAAILVAGIGVALGLISAGTDLFDAPEPTSAVVAEVTPETQAAETETEPETQAAETETEAEPETQAAETETEPETQAAETETQPEETETQAAETETETEPVTEAEAVAATSAEIETEPDAAVPADRSRSEGLVGEAEALALPADADRALALLEEALAVDPRNHEALAGMARVYYETDRPAQAIRYAERAARRAPRRVSYLILLGDAYLATRNRAAAQQAWLEAWEVRPSERLRRRLDRVGRAPE